MIVSSANTIALTQSDLRAARSQGISLMEIPQRQIGALLELQFANRRERDLWASILETALDNHMLGLPASVSVPASVAKFPEPERPGAVWTGFLYLVFWGAAIIGGLIVVLQWLAGR